MDPWRKGLASEAAAVHPDQIKEARRFNAEHGVRDTQILPNGSPVFRSRAHRKEYLKAWGLHDRNGGYGD